MKAKSYDRYRKDKGFKDLESLPKGPNGFPLCRFCRKETKPPQKAFCSDLCLHEFRIRTNANYMRNEVFKRDRGICKKCGLDTEKLRTLLLEVRHKSEDKYLELIKFYRTKFGFGFNLAEHFYEVDHLVPVHAGGGSCGLDNLQLLCRVCHRNKTRMEQKRKRMRRKGITSQWNFKKR